MNKLGLESWTLLYLCYLLLNVVNFVHWFVMFICCYVYLYLCILGSEFIIHVIYTFYIITANIAHQDVNNMWEKCNFIKKHYVEKVTKLLIKQLILLYKPLPNHHQDRLKWTGMNWSGSNELMWVEFTFTIMFLYIDLL